MRGEPLAEGLKIDCRLLTCGDVVARGGVEPPTFRVSVGRSYQLSYLAPQPDDVQQAVATPTGLEPATSAVTGRRSNQLSYGALLALPNDPHASAMERTPNGIRTRAAALKGRCPGPLDDGGVTPPDVQRRGRPPA